jgi:hypothetical protein
MTFAVGPTLFVYHTVRTNESSFNAWPTYIDHGHARLKKYFFSNRQSTFEWTN